MCVLEASGCRAKGRKNQCAFPLQYKGFLNLTGFNGDLEWEGVLHMTEARDASLDGKETYCGQCPGWWYNCNLMISMITKYATNIGKCLMGNVAGNSDTTSNYDSDMESCRNTCKDMDAKYFSYKDNDTMARWQEHLGSDSSIGTSVEECLCINRGIKQEPETGHGHGKWVSCEGFLCYAK